jgi:L-threonylcarbamoyladenylate synthase
MSRILPLNAKTVPLAYEALRRNELVVLPTDTVYGVAAAAWSEEAIGRLFEAKGRPTNNPIPLLLSDVSGIELVCAEVPPAAPAGGSLLAGAADHRPAQEARPAAQPDSAGDGWRSGARPRSDQGGDPLDGRRAGRDQRQPVRRPNPLTIQEAYLQLGANVTYYVDDGPAPGGQPSTVITFTLEGDLQIARHGPITEQALRAALA